MTDPDPGPEAPPGMPRWVKGAAIVVGLLILTFLVLQLTGIAGEHGPGMHGTSGAAPTAAWTAPVAAHG